MRKLLLVLVAAAAIFAPIAAAGAANAAPAPRTATFTAIQPAGQVGQFNDVWTHTFTVQVNADGSFSGTGVESGPDAPGQAFGEHVTGKFSDDNSAVSLTATRDDITWTWTLADAKTDGTTVTLATTAPVAPWLVEFKVTAPTYANSNHGECVSGATHAGIKGKALAAIAQDSTKVGPLGSATCKV